MVRLLGVLGSVTPPGRLASALTWTLDAARADDASVETTLLDLACYKVGFADGRPLEQIGDDSAAVVEMIRSADAVIFASPVYRASLTGALKNLLDLVPVEGLMGKPCGIVAMGATPHHFLGVEGHLRDVLAWFGAVTLPVSVYLASADFKDGQLGDAAKTDLVALAGGVLRMQALCAGGTVLGPRPLAARR